MPWIMIHPIFSLIRLGDKGERERGTPSDNTSLVSEPLASMKLATSTEPGFSIDYLFLEYLEEMKRGLIIILLTCSATSYPPKPTTRVCTVCNCSDRKKVDCSRLDLSSSFEPSSWDDITGANRTFCEINLEYNHIGRVTPFPRLNITRLSLRKNAIVKIDDLAFKNLTRLLELDLGENELTTNNLAPQIFQGYYNVEYYEPLPITKLDLSGNELHSLNSLVFQHLPHLRKLNLKRNPFKMLDKSTVIALSSLQELETLDLSYTQLKELPTGFLHSLKTLNELVLKGNLLKEIPSDVLFESHYLSTLNLDYNPIRVISTEKPFPDMPFLKYLHISHMPELRRIENYSMHGLKGLEFFDCQGNEKLEYISATAFASSENDTVRPNVIRMILNDNSLRYLDKSFLNADKMKYINLLGNLWSCDCENQWLVSDLIPILLKTHSPVRGLICSEPEAMKGKQLLSLYKMHGEMRCLDYYGNNPENDSIFLIVVFSLIIAAMAIGLIVIWKAKLDKCRRGERTDYSRAFYRPARTEEKY